MNDTLRRGDIGHDVATLQRRLNGKGASLAVDHVFGASTDGAVRAFQRGHGLVVDGIVGPRTHAALLGVGIGGDKRLLTQADIDAAAVTLGCDVAAIQAVISVESPKGGFLPDGRVVILFERHVMARQLQAAGIDPAPYEAARPDIVNTNPGGYIGGAGEYGRLAAAKQIDETAALCSASWGRFQIMGYHYAALGYATVQDFVADMATGEAAQLRAFVKFMHTDPAMLADLQNHRWPQFAALYNGPNYAIHQYDARLAQAFIAHGGVDAPGQKADNLSAAAEPETDSDTAAVDIAPPRTRRGKAAPEAAA